MVRWGLPFSGQPLFVNIQAGDLLRSNGGRLFVPEGRPTLTEKPVVELLDFYKRLNTVLPPGWTRPIESFVVGSLLFAMKVPTTHAAFAASACKEGK